MPSSRHAPAACVCIPALQHLLWQALRGGRLGVSFRRQVVIGTYIVDFLAPRLKLVVELDGGYHSKRGRADERRERWLRRQGYRVVRVAAADVVAVIRLLRPGR